MAGPSYARILSIGKLALLMCLLAIPESFAGKDDPEWNPPARYDYPYEGELIVRRLPQQEVVNACNELFRRHALAMRASQEQRGCSAWEDRRVSCTVITIDRPYKGATPEAVLRHEIGHCNGWPADHSD